MKKALRFFSGAALALGLVTLSAALAGAQSAHNRWQPRDIGPRNVGFVQTDPVSGNQVVAYYRAPDGTLQLGATYSTDGLGGQLTGSVVDHLASQGSLAYSANNRLLFAVNAGSDTISVFRTHNDSLSLQEVLPSGGAFPVSLTVHGNLVYVLNAENGGSVQGYRIVLGFVVPILGSNRPLGLDPSLTPQYTHTPGQVAFTPDGSQLVVTTKANGNDIDVFQVFANGQLSAAPTVNSEPNALPFAVTFDAADNLVVAETGPGALVSFSLSPSGVATELDAVATNQAATCWVTTVNGNLYASNAGSASVSQFQDSSTGILSFEGNTSTDPGTVDAAGSVTGNFLYVQTGGNGIVDEFQVAANGALSEIGSVSVAGAAGGEGILAF
ncbi:MAG: beta-propeller fold lactonase family protein [Acidimicrobiales bacterium]